MFVRKADVTVTEKGSLSSHLLRTGLASLDLVKYYDGPTAALQWLYAQKMYDVLLSVHEVLEITATTRLF